MSFDPFLAVLLLPVDVVIQSSCGLEIVCHADINMILDVR